MAVADYMSRRGGLLALWYKEEPGKEALGRKIQELCGIGYTTRQYLKE
jgi:hypothetical protein